MDTIRLALAMRRSSSERYVIELGIHDYVREHPEIEILCVDGALSLSWQEALACKPDALIGYFHQPSHLQRIQKLGIPTVSVNSVFNHSEISSVRVDSHAVGTMAAKYFIEKGCTDFTYLSDVPDHYYSARRQAGFCKTLKEQGHHAECITVESLESAVLCLQNKIGQGKRSAVFCVNDRAARALLNLLEPKHLKLEDSLLILGVDNDHFLYENGNVVFSSIDANHRLVGYLAAQQIHHQCHNRSPPMPQPLTTRHLHRGPATGSL